RLPRLATKQLMEARVSHPQAGAEIEIVQIELKAAILLQADQMLHDQVDVFRLAVRRKSHDLVFARVDLEPGVVRECRVQQAQRMWKGQVGKQLELVAASDAVARRGPLADTVHGQHRG